MTTTQTTLKGETMTYELHEGQKGNGATKWMVVAVNAAGSWMHVHEFDSKSEAECWIKWA